MRCVVEREAGHVTTPCSAIVQERLRVGNYAMDAIPVREVMTWAVVTIRPTTDLRGAARLMHEQKIGALPVTDDERLVGILTESDVLVVLEELLRANVSTVRPLTGVPSTDAYDYGFPEPVCAESGPQDTGPGLSVVPFETEGERILSDQRSRR